MPGMGRRCPVATSIRIGGESSLMGRLLEKRDAGVNRATDSGSRIHNHKEDRRVNAHRAKPKAGGPVLRNSERFVPRAQGAQEYELCGARVVRRNGARAAWVPGSHRFENRCVLLPDPLRISGLA